MGQLVATHASTNLYWCYSVCKKLQCETCKTKITSQVGTVRSIENALISRITKGGLLYPSSNVVHIATAHYIIVNKLAKTDKFKLVPSQCQLVIHTTMSASDEEDFLFFYEEACENNYKFVNTTKC